MWEWVNLEAGIIEIPAGVTKNDDALTLPLSSELLAMLNKRFKDDSPVFDSMNFRKEWEKACVKIGKGVIVEMKTPVKKPKPGEKKWNYWSKYTGLIPHDLRRSAVRNSIRAGNDQAGPSVEDLRLIAARQCAGEVDLQRDRRVTLLYYSRPFALNLRCNDDLRFWVFLHQGKDF